MILRNRNKPGRPPKLNGSLNKLKKSGIFDLTEARRVGISQTSLSRLVSEEKLIRVSTGLYMHPNSRISVEERDYAIACTKFGSKSVIGVMTALFHYGLIEQVPHKIWVLVPYARRTTDTLYRIVRTKTDPTEGVQDHSYYRMTNIERTLVEAFRYGSKIGLRIAFHATRTAIKEKKTSIEKIHRQAKRLRLEKFIERYWEALITESEVT